MRISSPSSDCPSSSIEQLALGQPTASPTPGPSSPPPPPAPYTSDVCPSSSPYGATTTTTITTKDELITTANRKKKRRKCRAAYNLTNLLELSTTSPPVVSSLSSPVVPSLSAPAGADLGPHQRPRQSEGGSAQTNPGPKMSSSNCHHISHCTSLASSSNSSCGRRCGSTSSCVRRSGSSCSSTSRSSRHCLLTPSWKSLLNLISNTYRGGRSGAASLLHPLALLIPVLLLSCCVSPTAAATAGPATLSRGLHFLEPPQSVLVRKSSPAWLHCLVGGGGQGSAPLTVQWIKDGVALDLNRDTNRHLLTNNSLYVEAVSSARQSAGRADEGSYQCLASQSALGSILSTPAVITVARLNKFSSEPRDLTAYEGEKARFECAITVDTPLDDAPRYWGAGPGEPSMAVLWHRDGLPIHLDSRMTVLPSGSLEISNLAMSDAGRYHCHVTAYGKTKVSNSGELRVSASYALRPPTSPLFIARPLSRVVTLGDNVSLDCAANGYPEPTVVWLKDGATIDMQHLDSRFHLVGSTSSLYITGVTPEDAGAYMCRAENRLDSGDSVAHLTVRVPPTLSRVPPPVVVSRERSDVELHCEVSGQPPPRVTWYKNAELIVYSEYFQLVSGHNLKILGLLPGDAGMYQCFGQSVAGTVQTATRLVLDQLYAANSTDNSNASPSINTINEPSSKNKKNKFHESQLSYLNNPSTGDLGPDTPGNSSHLPSAPREVRVLLASNRYVTLSWRAPQRHSDSVTGYLVYYRRRHSNRERVWGVSASPSGILSDADEYKTQIGQLTPGTDYIIRVVATVSAGQGTDLPTEEEDLGGDVLLGESSPPLEVSTRPDLDLPLAPSNLTVLPVSATALDVRWAPVHTLGGAAPVTGYKLYYMEVGSAEEQHIVLPVPPGHAAPTSHRLSHLHQFTTYSVWLVATNRHGDGNAPREEVAKTFSDVPSAVPTNVRAEPASSRSLIIRWEPPPLRDQNGVITGYKIRFRERGGSSGSSGTRTPDGSRRLFPLNGLKRDTSYSVKISALTVNGSGPVTAWVHAQTFANDLDESSVPGKPTALVANPKSTTITIRWDPPSTSGTTLVRGYTIGWGRGIPDVYTKIVDSSKRKYTIDGVEPHSEYVISVRAFNNLGDGQPVYEQVNTRDPEPEPQSRLRTPVGLKADVMTAFSVALSWTDTTLNSNQFIGNRGYYTVRYTTYASATSSSPRYRYLNVSDVTCLVDHLKPATMYEFTVKGVKGPRESRWSLVAANTTLEAKPSSSPRDVTVVTIRHQPATVVFNWQPPRQANGRITGYLIFYTTDPSLEWAVEQVSGDRLTWSLSSLTPHTTYYYKLQARNNKGHSPFTGVTNFTTLPASAAARLPNQDGSGGLFASESSLVVVVVASVVGAAVLLLIAGLFFVVLYCKKKRPHHGDLGPCATGTLKSAKLEVSQPPDLWIHHDRLELKNLDNHNNPSSHHHHHHHHGGASAGGTRPSSPLHTTTVLSHAEGADLEDKNNTYTSTSTLDRRTPYHSTYLRDCGSEDETERLLNRRSFRPKAYQPDQHVVGGSTSSSVYSDGTLGRTAAHPHHMQQQQAYCIDTYANAGVGGIHNPPLPPSIGGGGFDTLPPPPPPSLLATLGGVGVSSSSSGGLDALYSEGSNTLGKGGTGSTAPRNGGGPSNPLRSFSVPAPPQSAPTTPHPKHYGGIPVSPFKKLPPTSCAPPPVGGRRVLPPIGRVDSLPEEEGPDPSRLVFNERGDLVGGVSTEELTQEMANLEGLMKDLSAITASQFSC